MIEKLGQRVNLFERHLEVLRVVFEQHPIGILNIAHETGYPHHRVRYSLRVMKQANVIATTQQGAVPTEEGEEFVKTLQERIDDLINRLEAMKI